MGGMGSSAGQTTGGRELVGGSGRRVAGGRDRKQRQDRQHASRAQTATVMSARGRFTADKTGGCMGRRVRRRQTGARPHPRNAQLCLAKACGGLLDARSPRCSSAPQQATRATPFSRSGRTRWRSPRRATANNSRLMSAFSTTSPIHTISSSRAKWAVVEIYSASRVSQLHVITEHLARHHRHHRLPSYLLAHLRRHLLQPPRRRLAHHHHRRPRVLLRALQGCRPLHHCRRCRHRSLPARS